MKKIASLLGQFIMLVGIMIALLGMDERLMSFELFFGACLSIIIGYSLWGWANDK